MNIVQDKNMLPDDQWIDVCALDDLTPNTGAGALVGGQAVAIFRVGHEKRVYVLSNKDPFSQANVMSRGIIGDLQGERVVASPIYKQHFSLATGRCLEDKDQKLAVYPSKIVDGRVWVNAVPQKTYITNTGVSQDKLRLVLIGNGLAGMRCLEDLLDMAPDRYEVTVIGEEPWGNYNRIMLSPVLSGEKTIEDIMLHPPKWYDDKGIKFIAGDKAVKCKRPLNPIPIFNSI
ncbi:Nitrite reductase (NADH) small subunit [Acinetobacter baumannii]|nr:Nitrite reductase (NADH) small subunit [Acinetobacter baumannii]